MADGLVSHSSTTELFNAYIYFRSWHVLYGERQGIIEVDYRNPTPTILLVERECHHDFQQPNPGRKWFIITGRPHQHSDYKFTSSSGHLFSQGRYAD